MKRPLQAGALALALFAAGCGGDSGTEPEAAAPEVESSDAETSTDDTSASSEFPFSFTASTVDGGTLESASLAGQDVVFWFWAPW